MHIAHFNIITSYGFSNLATIFLFVQDQTLSKDEVRTFIHHAVKQGIFTDFFCM